MDETAANQSGGSRAVEAGRAAPSAESSRRAQRAADRDAAMDWLDLVLIVVVIGAAIHGLRLGAAVQFLSFGGMVVGLTIGVGLVLVVCPHVGGQRSKTFVALVLLLVPAAVLAGLGRQIGVGILAAPAKRQVRQGRRRRRCRHRRRRHARRRLDPRLDPGEQPVHARLGRDLPLADHRDGQQGHAADPDGPRPRRALPQQRGAPAGLRRPHPVGRPRDGSHARTRSTRRSATRSRRPSRSRRSAATRSRRARASTSAAT